MSTESYRGALTGAQIDALPGRVSANETDIATLNGNVGSLSDLETTDKSSIVKAINEVASGGGGCSAMMVEITYSELKTLRDAGSLVVGTLYRITDYTCTTVTSGTTSAGHQFDIVVLATGVGTLNENAYAMLHDGDTYFSSCDLNAWELKYCLDNDTTRFAWADSTNGKGVIFWMKDEFNNECPYDFKNIQFYRSYNSSTGLFSNSSNATGVACYTFSNSLNSDSTESNDYSLSANHNVYNNLIKRWIYNYKLYLNGNCFFGYGCYNNILENDCYKNTFGCNCDFNKFGNYCQHNILGDSSGSNIFGYNCISNIFGTGTWNNIFGNSCSNNTIGNSYQHNISGNNFSYNTFGNYCMNNTFGNNCLGNTVGTSSTTKSYCKYITFENGVIYICLNCTGTTSDSKYFQNIHINSGVQGTYSSHKQIDIATVGQDYLITVGSESDTKVNV